MNTPIDCPRCGKMCYRNQLFPLNVAGIAICPDCSQELLALLKNQRVVDTLVKCGLTHGEIQRMKSDRAKKTAWKDFGGE